MTLTNDGSTYLGLIPARGGSKGIPRKNLVDLAGKPLIAHTVEAALKSKLLDRVILSTDDEEIARLGLQLGVQVPFFRPPYLSADDSPIIAVVRHAVENFELQEGYKPTAVVLLQPTSPLRTSVHIDAAIELFIREGADSVISVSEPIEHPCDMVYFDKGEMIFALSVEKRWKGRQSYPTFYFVNGAIYILKVNLLPQLEYPWGGKVVPYLMSSLDSVDVDTAAHLHITELLVRRRLRD